MKSRLKWHKSAQFSVLFLLGTMPVLFGAVHPVVRGIYSAFILFFLGGWILLNSRYIADRHFFSLGYFLLFLFIFWIILSLLPVPLDWLQIISPVRASYLQTANQLANTGIRYAPLSYNTNAGVQTAAFLAALFVYASTLKILLNSDRSFLKKILYTCIAIGVIEALYGLIQTTHPQLGVLWLKIRQFKGMARGSIIYKNQYAALLNMIWPLAVGAALLSFKTFPRRRTSASAKKKSRKQKRRTRKTPADYMASRRLYGFLFLFLASVVMLAVLFSQSRGGTVSMIFILSLLLIFLPMSLKNKFFLSTLLIAIAAFYGSIIGYSSVFDRFLLIQQSGQHRINIWLSSLPMLQDHLWTGAGIGSYMLLSAVYLKQFPENIIFDRAHNDYLEFAIELGLPAALFFFLALIIFLLLFIIKMWPYTKKQFFRLPSAVIISFVSAAALIGFIIHGLVDFGWRLPANLLYLATLLVLLQHGLGSTAILSENQ